MRTIYLDPDFRPKPKTPHFCCVCYKDMRPDQHPRYVMTINGGMEAVHPEDYANVPEAVRMLIGSDCARRIGLEWSVP